MANKHSDPKNKRRNTLHSKPIPKRLENYHETEDIRGVRLSREEYENLRRLAVSSVVFRILNKNFSHTIGSHVLSYASRDLFVREILNAGKNIKEDENAIKKLLEYLQGGQYSSVNSYLDGIYGWYSHNRDRENVKVHLFEVSEDTRILMDYIRKRISYIAILSDSIGNIGKNIYSGSLYLMKDIIKEFLSQRMLLDYIARSEGLRAFLYEEEKNIGDNLKNLGRIKIHVFSLSSIPEFWDKKHNSLEERVNELKEINKKKREEEKPILLLSEEDPVVNLRGDIELAIPFGTAASHAFLSILENVIRNAAKHDYSGLSSKQDLEVVIEFKEEGLGYLFRVYTNMPNSHIVEDINKFIKEPLLKEDGSQNLSHLGIKEIVISSQFLKGDVDDLLSERPSNVKAIHSPIGNLSYTFEVNKPREIGIVLGED